LVLTLRSQSTIPWIVVAPKRIPDARAEGLLTDHKAMKIVAPLGEMSWESTVSDYGMIHRVVAETGRETNQDPQAHEVTAIGWWRGRELSR